MMKTLQKQKTNIFLASCIFVLFLSTMLMSCGKKPTYEGGHVAFSYDTNRWELSYVDTEPDITFNLQSDGNFIIIMNVEDDVAIVDNFHKDIIDMLQANYNVTEKGKIDQWDNHLWCYYEDVIYSDEPETIIIYAKELDNKILVGFSEIILLESEEENTELVNEVLDIFNSIEYSDKAEAGDIVQDENNSFAEYLYNNLNIISNFEVTDTDNDELLTAKEQPDGKIDDYISDEEFSELEYIEKIRMNDYDGNESSYYAYVPTGNSGCEDGFVSCWEHGLLYTAFLFNNLGATSFLYTSLEESVEYTVESWNDETYGYENIQIGEIQKNGNDRYQIISAQKEDYNGIPYEVKKISYIDVLDTGVGILWEMEITETEMDSETPLVIEELAKCYGINPDELQINGEWASKNEERSVNQQNIYDPTEEERVLEIIDGYEYMGLTTLSSYSLDKDVECPVMMPMGWQTNIGDAYASSSLHGISVSGTVEWIVAGDFWAYSNRWIDTRFKELTKYNDRNRNVSKGETIKLPDYNKGACFVVFTYEQVSYNTDEYMPMTDVMCIIRVNDNYFLNYEITLSKEEYDASTNDVLKELEEAYGIDLSEYYYE